MFGYGAAAALVVSFAALAVFWPEPRLEPQGARERDDRLDTPDPTAGRPSALLGVLGVALLLVVLGAAAFGDDLVTRNLAPVGVYVLFWVGVTVVCALVVDVWNAGLNPFAALGGAVAGPEPRPFPMGHWPAAVGLLAFVWAELVYPETGRPTGELADLFVHSLVPIAFAYAVAHYFSLLVLEGQAALALASDPFALGWDLFGTAGRSIDYTLVSPNQIAYVQVAAIVAGHVAGVVLAHDRALARLPKAVATRSQYPLLVTMVAFTVGGLGLLLGT